MEMAKNVNEICIWKDKVLCNDYKIKGKLQCHTQIRYTILFMVGWFSYIIPAIWGVVNIYLGGILDFQFTIYYIIGWIGYYLVFFLVWEQRILCRHCPYYAELRSKVLKCYANGGLPKVVKFSPKPMSKSEKIQFIVALLIFLLILLPILLLGYQVYPLIGYGVGSIFWIISLQLVVCPKCVNLSCPLNRVSKEVKKIFIEKNQILKKEWEGKY